MSMYEKMKERAIKQTDTKVSSKVVKTISKEDKEELNRSMQWITEENKKEKEEMGITMYAKGNIYASDDISFENRYKKLLEGVKEEELVQLPNPHEGNIVKSIDEIDCAKDGFIAKYCLGDIVSLDEPKQLKKSYKN